MEAGYLRGGTHIPEVSTETSLARPDDVQMSFSPDGRYLALKSLEGVRVYDTRTWQAQPLILANAADGWDYWFNWSRDSRTLTAYGTLAQADVNNFHWVYDAVNSRMLDHGRNDGQIRPPLAGDVSALATNGNCRIQNYDADSAEVLNKLNVGNAPRPIALTPDGRFLVVAGSWDLGVYPAQ